VNLKKRALGLVVTAGVVGSAVGIAAPSAGAAAIPPPDTCGVYIQGTVDPAGGVLPSGILPLDPPATAQTYSASGHLRKGQNKVINDLNNATPAVKRFSTGAELGEDTVKYPTSYLVGPGLASGVGSGLTTFAPDAAPDAGSKTTVKVAWANHKTVAGVTLLPTVQVAEANAAVEKYAAAKGTVTGISGTDTLGVGLGAFQQGQSSPSLQNTKYRLVTPKGATSGTFTLNMTIPANALAPGVPPVPIPLNTTHDWSDGAAAIETDMDLVYTGVLSVDSVDVTGTDFVAGTTNGDYLIEFNGVFTGSATPTLSVPTGTTTGNLAVTTLSDGSIWTGTRFGGPDPSNSPISHLGNFPANNITPPGPYAGDFNGIYTASGVMSAGPRGGVAGKNTGKANIVPDTQFVFVQYPTLIETTVAPRIGTGDAAMLATLGVLGAITGLDVATLNRNCGAAGLLALFCFSQPAIIPPTFAGLCGAILG
jgi:hypothetical protein